MSMVPAINTVPCLFPYSQLRFHTDSWFQWVKSRQIRKPLCGCKNGSSLSNWQTYTSKFCSKLDRNPAKLILKILETHYLGNSNTHAHVEVCLSKEGTYIQEPYSSPNIHKIRRQYDSHRTIIILLIVI